MIRIALVAIDTIFLSMDCYNALRHFSSINLYSKL